MKIDYNNKLYDYIWGLEDVRIPIRKTVDNSLIDKWFSEQNIEIEQNLDAYEMEHTISMNDEDYIFLCIKYL